MAMVSLTSANRVPEQAMELWNDLLQNYMWGDLSWKTSCVVIELSIFNAWQIGCLVHFIVSVI